MAGKIALPGSTGLVREPERMCPLVAPPPRGRRGANYQNLLLLFTNSPSSVVISDLIAVCKIVNLYNVEFSIIFVLR